jgi:hypothetical protein
MAANCFRSRIEIECRVKSAGLCTYPWSRESGHWLLETLLQSSEANETKAVSTVAIALSSIGSRRTAPRDQCIRAKEFLNMRKHCDGDDVGVCPSRGSAAAHARSTLADAAFGIACHCTLKNAASPRGIVHLRRGRRMDTEPELCVGAVSAIVRHAPQRCVGR